MMFVASPFTDAHSQSETVPRESARDGPGRILAQGAELDRDHLRQIDPEFDQGAVPSVEGNHGKRSSGKNCIVGISRAASSNANAPM